MRFREKISYDADVANKWDAYDRELRHHTIASDIDLLSDYYNKDLGIPIVKYWRGNDGSGTMLDLGGNILELFGKGDSNSRFSGNTSISTRVPDVKKYHNLLMSKKVKGISELVDNPWGDTSFDATDPEGNRITFFSPKDLPTYYTPGAKQADYRDRATLLLHNGQGGVLAAKNQHPENPIYPPYFFPGGGVFKEEGIRNSVTEEEIQEGLRREALEEIGHKLKNIDSLGTSPIEVNMGDAWAAKQLAKKGVPYKGFRDHIRAAMSDGIDNSILGSEGDDFTAYNPEYINANELASALESSLPGLRKAGDPTLVTSRLQTIEALKRLGNTKQADYRDRATLILHDNKGNVFAAPDVDGGTEAPYFFPGGGVYEEEGLFPVPDNKLIEQGLRREALEELGYKIKDIQDFGFLPTEIDKGRGWQNRVLAKRGVPYKGYREHLRAAVMDGIDESSYGTAGDSFHSWYPEYTPAAEVADAIEKHTNKYKQELNPSEYISRMRQVDFIRRLGNAKTAEEKRYRPKVQGLLYTPDLRVLAAKSQGAGSGLRQFNNYKFPGGGIEPGESLIDAAKKELLEETGYSTSGDPFEFGMPAATVDWDEAFRQQALKKGRDFHGEVSHFLAAPVGAKDMSLHGKEGDQLLDADFVPIDNLIADLEHTSSLPDNEYAMFDKNKLDAARRFKEHMSKKAYYIGRRLAIMSHS